MIQFGDEFVITYAETCIEIDRKVLSNPKLVNKRKLLVAEDDLHISELIGEKLKDEPFDITFEVNGREAYNQALSGIFDIIILDIMLPEMQGTEICRNLRMKGIRSIIIMLTSKSEEIDKILGLELGADDYMTKPFSPRELLSRIHARLRRVDENSSTVKVKTDEIAVIEFSGLTIHPEKRKVIRDSEHIELTPKEFDLLLLLAGKPGTTYTRGQLLNLVWGVDFEGFEHTVNTHINRLRMKIEKDPSNPKYILTTWGVGYRFAEYPE